MKMTVFAMGALAVVSAAQGPVPRLTGGIETQTACGSENNKDGSGGIIRGGGRSMAELATGLTRS
jgi:hypothetical protein